MTDNGSTTGATPSRHPARMRRRHRLFKRFSADTVDTALFASALLIGVAALCWGGHTTQYGAAALSAVGLAGLTRQAWRWRVRRVETLARLEQAAILRQRRSERRLREARDQEQRRVRVASDTTAHARAREVQDARRLEEREAAHIAEEQRRDRQEQIALAAAGLRALSDTQLQTAVADTFTARGFLAENATDEGCDLLLRGTDGRVRGVARIAPQDRAVDSTDVKALDSWRRDMGAASGFLVALAGFAPAAVHVAASRPITLVEAHLLAQWQSAIGRDGGVD